MEYQAIFKRYELKYMITQEQKARILRAMKSHMSIDQYGRDTIRNVYYDTEHYRLIRKSIEKPLYKEKIRVRGYKNVTADTPVYIELKKKYDSVVYKRRLSMKADEAMMWMQEDSVQADTQIAKEIRYFLTYYENLQPKVFLSYEREAYYSLDGTDFRVTFDENILCRERDLSITSEAYGTPILAAGACLMEIKCSGGIPMWMTEVLSKEKIYKTSFSKYGTYYTNFIHPRLKGEKHVKYVI